jgi:hypothetical protein
MTMTLQELLPIVGQLPLVEKIELRRLLEEETEATQDVMPFPPGHTVYLYTPYECSGVEILAQELNKLEAQESQ